MMARAILVLTLGALLAAALPTPADTGARAYYDVTHEFTFSDLYDLTSPKGVSWVIAYNDLGLGEPLKNFDFVHEQQIVTPVKFSPAEIETLKAYVMEGGTLYLVGAPRLPIAAVFEAFGAQLEEAGAPGPLTVAGYLRDLGAPERIALPNGRTGSRLVPPQGATVAVRGADGSAVVALATYGAGRVLFEANSEPFWRETRSADPTHKEASRATTVALIESLLPEGKRVPGTAPPGSLVNNPSTNEVKVGEGLAIYYPRTLAALAEPFLRDVKKVYALVRQWHPTTKPVGGTYNVTLLATGGGGYAGDGFVGLQTLGTLTENLQVVGHEMTHTLTPLAFPTFMREGWASYIGNRVGQAMGNFAFDGKPELQWYADILATLEPGGARVDLNPDPARADPRFYAAEIKAQWMIGTLEQRCGPDFMARVFEYRQAIAATAQSALVDEMLDLFGLAAGEDLSSWYKSLGLTHHPVIDGAVARQQLADYRLQLAEDRAGKADWERLKGTVLASDDWVRDWTLSDNTHEVGNDVRKAWLADTADPPALLRACGFRPCPPEARAKGLLVMGTGVLQGADAPRKTAKLGRTFAVPTDGRLRLCLGGMRAGVCDSALDLYVDDKRVWHCDQPTIYGRFYASVDLAPYAGRTVDLRLVLSGGWGAWSLIDYATLVGRDQ